jgi:hypothetical protein
VPLVLRFGAFDFRVSRFFGREFPLLRSTHVGQLLVGRSDSFSRFSRALCCQQALHGDPAVVKLPQSFQEHRTSDASNLRSRSVYASGSAFATAHINIKHKRFGRDVPKARHVAISIGKSMVLHLPKARWLASTKNRFLWIGIFSDDSLNVRTVAVGDPNKAKRDLSFGAREGLLSTPTRGACSPR